MSTITVVRKADQVAIAADSLSSWGGIRESADYVINHNKIIQVQGSYIAICGATSLKLVLKDYFSKLKSSVNLSTAEEIFKVWKDLHVTLKEDYFLNPDEDADDSFESSRMDVLIANRHGIFGISAHRAVQEFSRFYAYGTGCEFALGAMYSLYENEQITAEEVARQGVQAAAEFDPKTGLPIISYSSRLALSGRPEIIEANPKPEALMTRTKIRKKVR